MSASEHEPDALVTKEGERTLETAERDPESRRAQFEKLAKFLSTAPPGLYVLKRDE